MYNIDLVYLWCDGKDKSFLDRKNNILLVINVMEKVMEEKGFSIMMN